MNARSTFGEAPVRVIDDLRREFETLVGRFTARTDGAAALYPPVDVAEGEDGYELIFDLPGLSSDAIDLELRAEGLHIAGTRPEWSDDAGHTLHRVERTTGPFERTVPLPAGADPEQIEATYRDGVLKVAIAKTAAEEPRKVFVTGGVAAD
ncbi:MAG: Hsp20/alpha crystallin family protein [Planctomycetota bacterium]